jgi:hypothetical protein
MMRVVKLYHKDRHRKESKGGLQYDRERGVPCLDDSHGYFRLRHDSLFKQATLCMLWISHLIIFMVSGLHSSPVSSHLYAWTIRLCFIWRSWSNQSVF